MWIAQLNIGHKKLLLFVAFSAAVLWVSSLHPVIIAVLATLWTALGFAAYKLGVHVRVYQFISLGETYGVVDYFLPSDAHQNKRILLHSASGGVESSIFHHPQEAWSYLDVVRPLARRVRGRLPRALVLGGGGGALAISLVRDIAYAHVDVVDVSSEMIRVAKTFFVPKNILPSLSFHRADAIKFIRKNQKTYDLVVVDLFSGATLHPAVSTPSFVRSVRKCVAPGGILVVNFGFRSQNISKLPTMLAAAGKILVGVEKKP